jgi:hypothetical protein
MSLRHVSFVPVLLLPFSSPADDLMATTAADRQMPELLPNRKIHYRFHAAISSCTIVFFPCFICKS